MGSIVRRRASTQATGRPTRLPGSRPAPGFRERTSRSAETESDEREGVPSQQTTAITALTQEGRQSRNADALIDDFVEGTANEGHLYEKSRGPSQTGLLARRARPTLKGAESSHGAPSTGKGEAAGLKRALPQVRGGPKITERRSRAPTFNRYRRAWPVWMFCATTPGRTTYRSRTDEGRESNEPDGKRRRTASCRQNPKNRAPARRRRRASTGACSPLFHFAMLPGTTAAGDQRC